MSEDKTRTMLGGVLLAVGTAIILFVSLAGEPIVPGAVGSVAALVMAAGALLIGTARSEGRPV